MPLKTAGNFILLYAASFIALMAFVDAVRAQSAIQKLREEIRREFAVDTITTGYAALIDFAIGDEISSNTYFIGKHYDTAEINVSKLPIPFNIAKLDNGWRIFGQLTLGRLSASQNLKFQETQETVETTWRVWGGSIGVGAVIPVTEKFYVQPFLFVGYAKLENEANYVGGSKDSELRQAFDRIVFDWTLHAMTYGASLALGYRFSVDELDVDLRVRVTRTEFQAVRVHGDFPNFHSSINSVRSDAELTHPIPISIYGRRLSLVVAFSNTTFFGAGAGAIGSSYFFETGAALQFDLSGYDVPFIPVQRLRLGGNYVVGQNLTGYSIFLAAIF